ncbi:DNA replication and repair protein RecF [Bacteroidales bacterium]|nr:DNA replication and repair protein RecF [Bacteroidales bacterium]
MGKTNLLDALYFLSFCKNHTNLSDVHLINHQEDFFVLQGSYSFGKEIEDVYVGLKRKQRKVFKRNKKEYARLSEHIGLLPLVMISPADTELIQGGSEERRKFVDLVISQYDKEYLIALIAYNKLLVQRNKLLKDSHLAQDPVLYDIIEEQMQENAAIVYTKRGSFVSSFFPVFDSFYKYISGGEEAISFVYQSQLAADSLISLLQNRRERDKSLGYTSVGIHKDDFDFLLGEHLIRKIGSQGQVKTYLIALKLAQFDFFVNTGISTPILLLDDVFDKLDAKRVEKIIELVSQEQFGQIFVTDTNRLYLDEIINNISSDYKIFQVSNGIISAEEPTRQ